MTIESERKKMEKIVSMAENEWNVLKNLDHPGIVRLIDVYKDASNFYMVTEFCEGCELFEEVCNRQ
jgi:calcium-dependent protein kinase